MIIADIRDDHSVVNGVDTKTVTPCVECAAEMSNPNAAVLVLGFTGSDVRNALCERHTAALLQLVSQDWIMQLAVPFKNEV